MTTSTLPSFLSTVRRGDVARWSQTFIPTTRDVPAGAEMPSHVLLIRAGYVRQLAAGVYDYLPLAWRSLRKIQDVIREELGAAGASEMLLPAMEPIEVLQRSGRDQAYGDDLFRLTDRHGRVAALAPTHEEPIVELMRGAVTSYKQLPLNLYQIQTKFRDEPRPRAGLLRGREFIMKDAYSFHTTVEGPGGLNEIYDAMHDAYGRIFTRCGLDFTVVEAVAGPIGGSASHEFMVNCESGEDTILVCPESGYAANVEKCEIGERTWSFGGGADTPLERHHTPGLPGIAGVAERLGVSAADMLKCVVFEPAEQDTAGDAAGIDRWVVAVVRGDHEVNEDKVKDAVGYAVRLADEKAAKEAGFAIGYVSPRVAALVAGTRLVIDPDAASGGVAWATGADERDYHVTGFVWTRDLSSHASSDGPAEGTQVADVRNAIEGDPSPRAAGATLRTRRGIEVGHIFKLGTKYSDALGFEVMDKEQRRSSVIMGCYGIGVSRTLAACVEMSHDENGIVWPAALAPYHVVIVLMKPDETEHAEAAASLADELASRGVDVLIDDRPERAGVKFNDADLIGVPVRVTIGAKALAERSVEIKARSAEGKGDLIPIDRASDHIIEALA